MEYQLSIWRATGNFDSSFPIKNANRPAIQPSVSVYRKPGSESHTPRGSFCRPLAKNYTCSPWGSQKAFLVGKQHGWMRRYTCANRWEPSPSGGEPALIPLPRFIPRVRRRRLILRELSIPRFARARQTPSPSDHRPRHSTVVPATRSPFKTYRSTSDFAS